MDLDPPDDVLLTDCRATHQRRARDLVVIMATIAACQEATKGWFCCPVQIRIDVDLLMRKLP